MEAFARYRYSGRVPFFLGNMPAVSLVDAPERLLALLLYYGRDMATDAPDEPALRALLVDTDPSRYWPSLLHQLWELVSQRPLPADLAVPRALSDDEEKQVTQALRRRDRNANLLDLNGPPLLGGCVVTVASFKLLLPTEWLNDEIVNAYMLLLHQRHARHEGVLPRVCFFNSFFYTRLMQGTDYRYDAVRTWTRRLNLFGFDMFIVPVNAGASHWFCAVVNLRDRRIECFDSFNADHTDVMGALRRYVMDEIADKPEHRPPPVAVDTWPLVTMPVPAQENGNDCGVFCCQIVSCIARDHALTFTQADMRLFRRSMALELLNARLRTGYFH
jgi:sentrin-specific protease 1